MPETDPADAFLLAQSEDATTGVPYIETGASPYFLQFRRMLHRLLRASERTNDLRVYPAGGRMIGVRGGRCFVGQQPRVVAPVEPIELGASATTHLYIDDAGTLQTSTVGLPTDRATYIPLAEATTDADTVTQLVDLRGEAILQAQTAALAGITATAEEINRALDGAGSTVTAAHLDSLTAGAQSSAETLHRHLDTVQQVDGEAAVRLTNLSGHADANIALDFSLPGVLADATHLRIDRATGFLEQRHLGVTRSLVGATHVQMLKPGTLKVAVSENFAGLVPATGTVSTAILSCGTNTESSDSTDGVSARVFVNGSRVTTTDPSLTAADGPGFVSTDQGAGTPAVIDSGAVSQVQRGDVLTVEVDYSPAGTVTQKPADVAVLIVIRAERPE